MMAIFLTIDEKLLTRFSAVDLVGAMFDYALAMRASSVC